MVAAMLTETLEQTLERIFGEEFFYHPDDVLRESYARPNKAIAKFKRETKQNIHFVKDYRLPEDKKIHRYVIRIGDQHFVYDMLAGFAEQEDRIFERKLRPARVVKKEITLFEPY